MRQLLILKSTTPLTPTEEILSYNSWVLWRTALLILFSIISSGFLHAQELSYLAGPNPNGPREGHIEFRAKFKKSGEWAYSSIIHVERSPTTAIGITGFYYKMQMDLKESENKKSQYRIDFMQTQTFRPISSHLKQWEVSGNTLVFDKNFIFEEDQLKTIDNLNQKKEAIATDKLTYPSDSIALLLMGVNFEEQDNVSLRVILRGSGVYNISVKNLGKEFVQTPAGNFFCHKLEIRPDLGFMNYLVGFAIPSIIYWQTVTEPHRPIQYEGPIAGPFSEHIQAKVQKVWFK